MIKTKTNIKTNIKKPIKKHKDNKLHEVLLISQFYLQL